MSKRKDKKYKITSAQLFDFNKPQFNGYTCGHGAHRDKTKYCRRQKHKRDWIE